MFNNNHNRNDNTIRPIPVKIFDSKWVLIHEKESFYFTFITEGMDFPLYLRKETVECRDG